MGRSQSCTYGLAFWQHSLHNQGQISHFGYINTTTGYPPLAHASWHGWELFNFSVHASAWAPRHCEMGEFQRWAAAWLHGRHQVSPPHKHSRLLVWKFFYSIATVQAGSKQGTLQAHNYSFRPFTTQKNSSLHLMEPSQFLEASQLQRFSLMLSHRL